MKNENQVAPQPVVAGLDQMSLRQIAVIVRRDWKRVSIHAEAYLGPLGTMDKISDAYYNDTGASVVAYFLSNATSWTGPVAREVKKELNKRLKASYKR